MKQTRSGWLAKTITSFIVGILMFIPAYLLGFFWWLANPVGFWQVFAIVAGWVMVLGVIQVGFLICGVILIVGIILDEL